MITETTGEITLITLIPENIPEGLKRRPQWVCWRYEERDGKLTKVPYTPETGVRASTTDLMAWRTFEDVVMGLDADADTRRRKRLPRYDGIGFVFSSADPFCGIDLDKCRDPESGEIAAWSQEILGRVRGGYVEASPSGTGIHIITRGSVRDGGMRKGSVEMYSRGRFFTITGQALDV